jgi:hypothetical protein
MRQLQYILAQFYIKHGYLPAYTVDDNNKPLHSWRVLLLPYIEEKELYDKIRLDEPWDSEYNSQFHYYTIPIYQCPGSFSHRKPVTNYFFVTGAGSCFDESGKYVDDDKSPKTCNIKQVSTSSFKFRTEKILLVESSKEVHWMCPVDITFDEYKSDNFKPANKGHFNIITSDNFNIEFFLAPFYWDWTMLDVLIACVLLVLFVSVLLQICYVVLLLFYCLFKRFRQKT